MIDHVWTVLCANAILDKFTNNLTLVNTIERISVPGDALPGVELEIPITVVSLWSRSDPDTPSSGKAKLRCVEPGDIETLVVELELDLTQSKRLRTIRQITPVTPLPAGHHLIQTWLWDKDRDDWTMVGQIPLEVNITEPTD